MNVAIFVLLTIGYSTWFLFGYWTGRKAELRRHRLAVPDSPFSPTKTNLPKKVADRLTPSGGKRGFVIGGQSRRKPTGEDQ